MTDNIHTNVTCRSFRVITDDVEKATSITYSKCVSVPLVIWQAMRMRRIVICGLSGSKIYTHITS